MRRSRLSGKEGFYYSAFGGDGSERGTTTVRASGQAHVSIVPFLSQRISRLMPLNDNRVRNLLSLPPRGKALASTWFLMPFRPPYRFIPANTKPRRLSGRKPTGFVECSGILTQFTKYAHMRICAHENIYFFGADCFLSGGAIENLISSSLRQLYSTTSHKCVNTSTACLRVEMTRFSPPTASECV